MKYALRTLYYLSFVVGISIYGCQTSPTARTDNFSDRVNLALRHVGHQLLKLEGDAQSPIPPVTKEEPFSFTLNVQHSFNYDTLPTLLHHALVVYNIDEDYHVVVERCEDQVPILGYNFQAFSQGEVACAGRESLSECNNIVLVFRHPTVVSSYSWTLILCLLLAISIAFIGYILWRLKKVSPELATADAPNVVLTHSNGTSLIAIGKFKFDYKNQILQLGNEKQDLTFRENKLLHHLVQHVNEIQTRDMLIDEVWADEGVLVGRSLDVFISRLRKLLKADENISIKSIHGVGYRLELVA